jgi:hypothetical protein
LNRIILQTKIKTQGGEKKQKWGTVCKNRKKSGKNRRGERSRREKKAKKPQIPPGGRVLGATPRGGLERFKNARAPSLSAWKTLENAGLF